MTQPPPAEGSAWTPPGGSAEPGPEAQPHPDPQVQPQPEAWDALKVGDCVTFKEGEQSHTVRTVPCRKRHKAQMVLSFALPAGPWPGDGNVSRSGEKGCNTRLNSYFEKHPNPVDIRFLHVDPLEQAWNTGYREVRCLAEGDKGKDLTRSLMP